MGNTLDDPAVPHIDATLTIFPDLCRTITDSTSRAQKNAPSRLTSITARQSAVVTSCTRVFTGAERPALLNRTSTRPWRSTAAETIRRTASSSVTSHSTAVARRPSARTRPAVASAAGSARSAHTTSAPASAHTSANSVPKPPPAPVTRTTQPVRSKGAG
jgi:hypothetical protein